ncbi:MAG: hypothetical protein LUQ38_00155 [Methanotrichaceae archaeon]|nr:hypothetical protein [Methanotrichaceae archaeon]
MDERDGSINLESLRGMKKIGRMVGFTLRTDLVFAGGQLKNKKSLASPLFNKATVAIVHERFNLNHVNKKRD